MRSSSTTLSGRLSISGQWRLSPRLSVRASATISLASLHHVLRAARALLWLRCAVRRPRANRGLVLALLLVVVDKRGRSLSCIVWASILRVLEQEQ